MGNTNSYKDNIGKKYGRLTFVDVVGKDKGNNYIGLFKCECGKYTKSILSNVYSGKKISCGCAYKYQKKHNIYEDCGDYYKVHLVNDDRYFLIDKEDKELIDKKYCSISVNGYPCTNKHDLVHTIIMGKHDGMVVDHINNNKLDNRKSNLRIITYKLNTLNRKNTPSYITKVKRNNNIYYIVSAKGKYHGCFKLLDEAKKVADELIKQRNFEIGKSYL